ncbi:hypothetical protein [Levilactobacillus yiduensis]|uniref:hypothetical protein n=1 Tax=Levilactobacillus yiduensis TaxID=2953880 RepID=UPI000EF2A200|nr:hypothetical protein [Levilactobacillus yiduensis]AYM01483.1 hypothetical protein D8911_00195 [Levilactobacillus brevis]
MKKVKSIALTAITVLGLSVAAPLISPAQTAQASAWEMKYIDGWYRVKIKKTTKVKRIKYGALAYQNKVTGHYTLHKGSIVKTTYSGHEGFEFIIKSPHKYKMTSKYGYSAHFKKGSFKVLSHTN